MCVCVCVCVCVYVQLCNNISFITFIKILNRNQHTICEQINNLINLCANSVLVVVESLNRYCDWFTNGAHLASYMMGAGSFQGVKPPGRGVDHPPHLTPRLKKEYIIRLFSMCAFVACCRAKFTFNLWLVTFHVSHPYNSISST